MDRANAWLRQHSNLNVRTCESIESKRKSHMNQADTVKSTFTTHAGTYVDYNRSLRYLRSVGQVLGDFRTLYNHVILDHRQCPLFIFQMIMMIQWIAFMFNGGQYPASIFSLLLIHCNSLNHELMYWWNVSMLLLFVSGYGLKRKPPEAHLNRIRLDSWIVYPDVWKVEGYSQNLNLKDLMKLWGRLMRGSNNIPCQVGDI